MKVMIDTNVIISAILKQNSMPDCVLNFVCEQHKLVLCEQIIEECYVVSKKRFPKHLYILENLFMKIEYECVASKIVGKIKMIDIKDQPIINSAIANNVDVLISGDKHFLNLDICKPEILSPKQFFNKYINFTYGKY